LVIVREILTGTDNFDTAVYSGNASEYTVAVEGNSVIVTDLVAGRDGVDRLTGIERLQFADQAQASGVGTAVNSGPVGRLAILDGVTGAREDTPVAGQLLRVSNQSVRDLDSVSATNPTGAVTGPVSYYWQVENVAGSGIYEDITVIAAGEASRVTGTTYRVADDVAGLNIRVRAVYQDADSTLEFVDSSANNTPTAGPTILGLATQNQVLTADPSTIIDVDGLSNPQFTFQWQETNGVTFVNIPGATGSTFTLGQAQVGDQVRVVVSYVDDFGVAETVASDATAPVANVNDAPTGALLISDTTPTQGQVLTAQTAGIADPDGLGTFSFQWQQGVGTTFTNIAGATNATFTPGAAQINQQIRVIARYTDGFGTLESVTSAATALVVLLGAVQTGDALANTLVGTAGSDVLFGLGGNDTLIGLGGVDQLFGGIGDDNLSGGDGNDFLNGEDGNDFLNGGAGNDQMLGGTGNDTFRVDSAGDVLTELTGEGADSVQTTLASFTLGANMEHLLYLGAANFTGNGNALNNVITGGTANDTLNGGDGNDTLIGGAGNDVLTGGAGNDAMAGGAGNDTFRVDSAGDLVTEAAGEGSDSVQTTLASYTLGANVENLLYTGTGNFTGNGNALNNVMTGGVGNDTLNGGDGNDTLLGGAGNDVITGGAGNDRMVGALGNDTFRVDSAGDLVVEVTGEGADSVQTTLNSYTLGANVEHMLFTGAGNFVGTGNALSNIITAGTGNDTLNGGDGNDTLLGGLGNDVIDGGVGADRLEGGVGNDTYRVDSAADGVIEVAASGEDSIQTSLSSYTLGANAEHLLYTGVGNFVGTGNASNNVITGGVGNDNLNGADGNDTLLGGLGSDIIDGGAGNDSITGGAGNDTMNASTGDDVFVFGLAFGNDRIIGFDANAAGGQDLLNFAALNITAATFNTSVNVFDQGADTLLTFGAGSITLVGVGDPNTISATDFILAS
jgi:Ca2+-binding RTX toxin-like protein